MFNLFRIYGEIDKEIKNVFKKHDLDDESVVFILSLLADEYMQKAGIPLEDKKSN